MPREFNGTLEFDLPVSPDLAATLAGSGSPLSELALLPEDACREKLRATWAGLQFAAHGQLAEFLLSQDKLCVAEHTGPVYRLAFSSGEPHVWLPAANYEPPSVSFPFAAIPGLLEFITHFGGLSDFCYLGGSAFVVPSELRVMWNDDEDSAWGPVADWDGSLLVYQGGTGDCIVIRPDGAIGKWHHEQAGAETLEEHREQFAEEVAMMRKLFPNDTLEELGLAGFENGPVLNLNCDFKTLIERYPAYCRAPVNSDEKRKSPFYY